MLDLAQEPCWVRWRTGGRSDLHLGKANIELTIFHEGGRAVAFAEPMHSQVEVPLWKRLARTALSTDKVGLWSDWRIANLDTDENLLEVRTQTFGLSDSLGNSLEVNCASTPVGTISPGGHRSRPLVATSGVEATYAADDGRDQHSSTATVRSGDTTVASVIKQATAPAGLVPTDGQIWPLDFGFLPAPGADPDLVTLSLVAAILDTAARNEYGRRSVYVERVSAPDGVTKREAAAREDKRRDDASRERMMRQYPQLREALERRKTEGR